MSSLASLYIKQETLEQMVKVLQKKAGVKGIELTISINDDSNEYGQNVTSFVSQTEEQRKEKKPRFYVGNGKVYWTDGKIQLGQKPEPKSQSDKNFDELNNAPDDDSNLPF